MTDKTASGEFPDELYIYETKLDLGVTYWPHHGNRKTVRYIRAESRQMPKVITVEEFTDEMVSDGDMSDAKYLAKRYPNGLKIVEKKP